MDLIFGEGTFTEDRRKIDGQIILSEHKLCLRGPDGDIAPSYIPLEKIELARLKSGGLQLSVRPSLAYRYTVAITGQAKSIRQLAAEIVRRRGLKKKFLKNEWFEQL